MMRFFRSVFPIIGVDAGARYIRVVVEGKGVVFDELSLLAINKKTQKILAIGNEAAAMQNRVAGHIAVLKPFQDGEVYDLKWARLLLQVILQQSLGARRLLSPTFVFALPVSATPAAHSVYTELFYSLGASEVISVAAPLAAGIGAGVPIADSTGSFILHGGYSLSECVVISLGSIIEHSADQVGIAYVTQQLQKKLRHDFDLEVDQQQVEQLLLDMPFAVAAKKSSKVVVSGKDVTKGTPTEASIYAEDLLEGILRFKQKNNALIKQLLSQLPTGLAADVISKGILVTGGFGKLENLAPVLSQELGVPVSAVEQPQTAVLRGLLSIIENIDEFKSSLGYTADVASRSGSL